MNNVLTKKFLPRLTLNEFLEESQLFVEAYSCPLCEGILNDSVIDRCGHSYCRECVETLLRERTNCPFTNLEITEKNASNTISANIVVNSVIEKQKVYCKNKSVGCNWAGKLLDRKNHLLHDCEKELIECEYSKECTIKITRDQIHIHMQECPYRIVLCHHCQQYANYNKIEEHYKNCPSFPINCANNCGVSVPSSQIHQHLDLYCDNTVTECPFNVVGCDFIDLRKVLKIHLTDNLEHHLKLINKKIKGLEDVINIQKSQIKNLEIENEEIKKDVDNTKNVIDKNQEEIINSLNNLSKNMVSMKYYFNIPQSNYLPNFFDENMQMNSSNNASIREIFSVDNENLTITKYQENYGWYGISSEPFDISVNSYGNSFNSNNDNFNKSSFKFGLNLNKIVINIKILKSLNSCIMFGITFSNLRSPLQNGFYNQTSEDNISIMFYTYNSSIYFRGRANTKSKQADPCMDGDIISMIIDPLINTISFRKNGIQTADSIELEILSKVEYRRNVRVAVDLCDYQDQVIFLL